MIVSKDKYLRSIYDVGTAYAERGYTANDPEKYGKAIIFKNKDNKEVVRLNVKKEQFDELKDYLFEQKEKVIEGMSFLSQCDSTATADATGCNRGCCWAVSCWIINQMNNTNINHNSRVYFEDAVNIANLSQGITPILSSSEFNSTIKYIKTSIKSDKPILIGTWDNRTELEYTRLGPNAWNDKLSEKDNSPTTHFMVIVGFGYDEAQEKYYFLFYDPGRNDISDGTSPQNKLYIDETAKEIFITGYRNRTYKITEIRKNY